MRIPIKYMQLHNPLFLAGINLGTKLDITRRPMVITYDREFQEVHVYLNGQLSILPAPAISDMIPIDASPFLPHPNERVQEVPKSTPVDSLVPKKPIKAQVSSPLDHVFASRADNVKEKP